MDCTCPTIWNGIYPPPCDVHNPPPKTYTPRRECATCGAVIGNTGKHAEWHAAQAAVARNADLGAMSMRPIGGPR